MTTVEWELNLNSAQRQAGWDFENKRQDLAQTFREVEEGKVERTYQDLIYLTATLHTDIDLDETLTSDQKRLFRRLVDKRWYEHIAWRHERGYECDLPEEDL